MPFRQIAVIDCGARGIAFGFFRLNQDGLRCDSLVCEPLSGHADTEAQWLEATVAAIRSLGEKVGQRGPVVLVLPPHVVLLKHLQVPRVDAAKREQVVRFEVEQNIPFPLGEVSWDTVSSGESEAGESLLLAAAKRAILLPLCAAARGAGFKVQAVIPAALAVRAATEFARPPCEEKLLVISTNTRSATLLLQEGARFAARSCSVGSRGEDSAAGSGSLATRLVQEAMRTLLHFRKQHGLSNPVRVLVTGDAAGSPAMVSAIGAGLKLPAETLSLTPSLAWAPGVLAEIATIELVGGATLQLLPGWASLDLMPAVSRHRARLRHLRPWAAVALLALGGLAAPWAQHRRLLAVEQQTLVALEETQARLRARSQHDSAELAQIPVSETPDIVAEAAGAAPEVEASLPGFPLRLSGYAGEAGSYVVMFIAPNSAETLLARVGQRFDDLDLVLKAFEVRKVLVMHDSPWPIYDVAGFATLVDERTGDEVVLDSRTGSPLDDALAGNPTLLASDSREALNHGP